MSDPNKDFDGIKQGENPLPVWWKWVFLASILVGILYPIYFHVYSSNEETPEYYASQVEEYTKQFPNKNVALESADGSNPLRGNANAIATGETTFKTYCVACHGPTGEGLVGPNLMDKEWLHGNTDNELYENVMKGISVDRIKMGRGPMPPHEMSLGSEKVYQVLAWIASKNPNVLATK